MISIPLAELSSDSEKSGFGKTVFIVDELDRCRPDFALSLLESLKHFFRAEGLHFLLVTNLEYLAKSVNSRYGLEDKSEEYLQKFYDFTVYFEEASGHDHQHASALYGRQLVSEMLTGVDAQYKSDIEDYLSNLAIAFNLTLRQVEHVAVGLILAYLSLRERAYAPTILVTVLSFLKALHPSVYGRIKLGAASFEDVDRIISAGRWSDAFHIERLRNVMEYHLNADIDVNDERFQGYGQSMGRSNFRSRLDVLPYLANSVLDRFSR